MPEMIEEKVSMKSVSLITEMLRERQEHEDDFPSKDFPTFLSFDKEKTARKSMWKLHFRDKYSQKQKCCDT